LLFKRQKNPELSNLLHGYPCKAEAFIRRIPIKDVPYEDDQQCSQFIHKLFQEKDKVFDYFLRHDTFAGAGNPVARDLGRKIQDLIIEIVCLIVIGLPSLYYFIKFLLTASVRSQIILIIIVMAAILGVRSMIRTASRPKMQSSTKEQ